VYRDAVTGWRWDTDEVVRVPVYEIARELRAYNRVLQSGGLIEVTEEDYDAYQALVEGTVPQPKASKARKRPTADNKE